MRHIYYSLLISSARESLKPGPYHCGPSWNDFNRTDLCLYGTGLHALTFIIKASEASRSVHYGYNIENVCHYLSFGLI